MAGLISTGIWGFICSMLPTGERDEKGRPIMEEHFNTGFAGWGWKIWKTVAGFFRLEIDELVVRRTMTVFELLIQKIRAVVGAQAITQGNGKIKGVELSEDGTTYLLTLEEDEISIVEYDFIRCQVFSGGQRFYHVEVASVEGGVIYVPASEFAGSSLPLPGDEVVQFGNSSHNPKYAGRHSAIYMHTDESGQPAIDVMFDIYSKNWAGCTKVRVGGDIPGSSGLKGFYCENGMIKGVDSTGRVVYCIYPDGSAMFGDGSAQFNTDRSGHIAGGAIAWQWDDTQKKYVCTMKGVVLTWDNLDDKAKENLKGEPGGKGDTGAHGADGTDGVPGAPGADGKTTYTWIAYSDNADGSGMYQVPRDSTKYIGIAVNKDTKIEGTNPADYTWSLFKGKDGEDGKPGEDGRPGSDANLLPWIEKWNKYATELGEEYIVTPKMFSGTKANGKLTGIAQGKDCITIDGVTRTGIFALVDDKVVFALDPKTKEYKFVGRVEATEGTFTGEVNAKSGKIAGFTISNGVLENKEEGVDDEMLLSGSLIRFLNSYASVFLGADTYPATGGGALVTPIRIGVDRNTNGRAVGNTGMHLSVKGAMAYDDMVCTGNSALYIPDGHISGFRLRQRRLNTSQTLSKMDSIILSIAQHDVTYTLPSECEDGQLIIIKKQGGGNITVTAASGDTISETFDRRVQSTHFEKGYCLQFCYDSVNKSWWMVDTADQWK